MAAKKAAAAAKPAGAKKRPAAKAAVASKPKGKRGPPPHQKTEPLANLVQLCKAIGYTKEQAARCCNFSVETLDRYYAEEWEKGEDRINAAIAGNLASIARDRTHPRSVVAAIFWMKTRAKWNDGNSITIRKGEATDLPEGDGEEPVVFSIRIGERKEAGNG